MVCAWDNFLQILPLWMRQDVNRLGRNDLQELRLRLNMPPELRCESGALRLFRKVTQSDMHFCINTASKYSPWLADTAKKGFITAPGGHRIGLCGTFRDNSGSITDIASVTSLCVRVARDFPGVSTGIPSYAMSVLILGRPGKGKTTLLRDMIRNRSENGNEHIAVVDEREEIFPRSNGEFCFYTGKNTDVLSGCNKSKGMDMVMRAMGPDTIAVDEITTMEDTQALLHAGWCGVNLLATAHASSCDDLKKRPVYRNIIDSQIFDAVVILDPDKSWHIERLKV